ncbi:MAG: TetR/AcrR family transcriptional regulator [Pseudomonadales bacterium]|nr:TetR/AcrR family transcriptional regulator [Pseudomonadales bacterium]MCP5184957.1 TetR/AcrR family transcriptional regulator [Pseudomonadales bacterium]
MPRAVRKGGASDDQPAIATQGGARRKYESPRQLARQTNILATAREQLAEVGYAGMTMRGLAQAAGVAQGTLYNLYKSKDELIVAAIQDLLTSVDARAREREPADGIDAILAVTEEASRQIQATPGYADAVARALLRVQPDDPLIDVLFGRLIPFISRQLDIARKRRELVEGVNIDLLTKHLVGQSWGVILLWLNGFLPLRHITRERHRSELMTLVAVTRGRMKKQLEAKLRAL